MISTKLRIATRQSPLALWQAHYVREAILRVNPGLSVEIRSFLTEGDKKTDVNLTKIGGKGLFVKELQAALFSEEADIAVHSIKDMPAEPMPGLILIAVCEREDPRDVLVGRMGMTIKTLPSGAIVGTSSSRRACLLRNLRSDIVIEPLRGNIGTRLAKLDKKKYDAIILAAAGLKRLGEVRRICSYLNASFWTPSVGQGAIGIECSKERLACLAPLLLPLEHELTRRCIIAERSFNAALDGGCQLPIAAHAVCLGNQLLMRSFIAHPVKALSFRAEISGSADNPQELGRRLAALFLEQGGEDILREVKSLTVGY